MSIPRISLWTDPFAMPLRLATRLSFRNGVAREMFTDQAGQIQANHCVLSITPGAMYILSSVAGRRIVDPVRWVLLDSLHDVLDGELRTRGVEHQDLLDSTFGEILGALCTALSLDGNAEIIRLVEGSKGKSPDFFVIELLPGGERRYHLLECKGSVQDVNNINARDEIDLCAQIRQRRNDAEEQLRYFLSHNVILKPGVAISVRRRPRAGGNKPQPRPWRYATSINAAVVCVPDGRIPLESTASKRPKRSCCKTAAQQCLTCITARGSGASANAIVALFQEDVPHSSIIQGNLDQFLVLLRQADHAIWADDEGALNRAAQEAIRVTVEASDDRELQAAELALVLNVLEEAVQQELNLNEDTIGFLATQPLEDDQMRLEQLSLVSRRRRQRLRRQEEAVVVEVEEVAIRLVNLPRQSRLTVRTGFYRVGLNIPNAVEGTVRSEGEAAIIRLVADLSTLRSDAEDEPQGYEGLRRLVEQLIDRIRWQTYQRLRERFPKRSWPDYVNLSLVWRSEEAVLTQLTTGSVISGQAPLELQHPQPKVLQVGHSWDKFPYPSSYYGLPGITTWVARDGRAEIIVRFPEPPAL